MKHFVTSLTAFGMSLLFSLSAYAGTIGITMETSINYIDNNSGNMDTFEIIIKAWNDAGDEPAFNVYPVATFLGENYQIGEPKMLPVTKLRSTAAEGKWERAIQFDETKLGSPGDYPMEIVLYYQDKNMAESKDPKQFQTMQLAAARYNPNPPKEIPTLRVKTKVAPSKPSVELSDDVESGTLTLTNETDVDMDIKVKLANAKIIMAYLDKNNINSIETNVTLPKSGTIQVPFFIQNNGATVSTQALFFILERDTGVGEAEMAQKFHYTKVDSVVVYVGSGPGGDTVLGIPIPTLSLIAIGVLVVVLLFFGTRAYLKRRRGDA